MAFAPLSQTQAKVLLHKHLTGDFPRRCWPTIAALLREGMLEARTDRLTVTAKGYTYCVTHHRHIPSGCTCHP
jgi:hypothetical protein